MRKKVDKRIVTMIENGVKNRHRSMFVIVGDKHYDTIVNLHYMLGKALVKSKPNVLWCYKDRLELSSNKKKRADQTKKLVQRGLLDPEKADAFSLFLETGGIQYCLYKDSERVLGNTFSMCILQDFEALTPNLLARTMETVEGGGLVVLLLRSLSSLTSLSTMVMDVHERFRTESHMECAGRFNERFLLSLASCKACVVMDDEFNILPISSHIKTVEPVSLNEEFEGLSEGERDLKNLKDQLNDDFPVGPLIKKCCTLDQGKAVITFLDAVLDKTLRSTVALLAGRGRGKSAALGLAVSGAIAAGYSNIFVTAPSPENLKTLFDFVGKGFDALEYKEHLDYDVVKSTNPEFKNATIRINIYKQHRQTIQAATESIISNMMLDSHFPISGYQQGEAGTEWVNDFSRTANHLHHEFRIPSGPNIGSTIRLASLSGSSDSCLTQLVLLRHTMKWLRSCRCSISVDLSQVQYLMFNISTLEVTVSNIERKADVDMDPEYALLRCIMYIQPNEREKLSQVELLVIDEAAAIPLTVVKSLLGPYLVFLSSTVNGYEGTGRSLSLKLIQQLEEPNQISSNSVDNSTSGRLFKKIELTEAIRYAPGDPIETWLHALLCLDATNSIPNIHRLPSPGECDLYYVNRDILFSYQKDSEIFLQRMMALYVASHYKNSPNDLQLISDAPAHHLFVLLGPVEKKNQLPDILCVIQICLEGTISRKSAIKSLSDGHQPSGDQIPWKFCEQFQDTVFPSLSGARIVRIATHPNAMRLGYGSIAVELLTRYFEGQLIPFSEYDDSQKNNVDSPKAPHVRVKEAAKKVSLKEEYVEPRTDIPTLLVHLPDRRPEKLSYLGVSFGLTYDLFNFWKKHKFAPFYIGQIPSSVTGEHTCMVLKPLNNGDTEVSDSNPWGFLQPFFQDFRQRFIRLLGSSFRSMELKLAMRVLDPKINFAETELVSSPAADGFLKSLNGVLTPYDMKRLESYTNNLADFHMILDLVRVLSNLYFREKFPITLSSTQASVLLSMGLQNNNISYVERVMELERQQIMSLFIKVMKKLYKYLHDTASNEVASTLPRLKEIVLQPHAISLDEDLEEGAQQVKESAKSKMQGTLDPELFQEYAIVDKEADFEKALQSVGRNSLSGVVTIKSSREKGAKHEKRKDKPQSGKKEAMNMDLSRTRKENLKEKCDEASSG